MNVKNTYPPVNKKAKIDFSQLVKWIKWPFIIAVIALPVTNIIIGGTPWSLVALWALFMLWSFIFSPALVEYNRLSNAAKLIAYTAILLVIIRYTVAPQLDITVIALVGFGGLILLAALFFSNIRKQKQNIFPMLIFIVVSIIFGVIGLSIWQNESAWQIIVFAATAIGFLLTIMIVLRSELITELKKRFHTL